MKEAFIIIFGFAIMGIFVYAVMIGAEKEQIRKEQETYRMCQDYGKAMAQWAYNNNKPDPCAGIYYEKR